MAASEDEEMLLVDRLRLDSFREEARKRKETVLLRRLNNQPAEPGELVNALFLAMELVRREANNGNYSAEMIVSKAEVRKHIQQELVLEGLTVRDDEQYQKLHIQWT